MKAYKIVFNREISILVPDEFSESDAKNWAVDIYNSGDNSYLQMKVGDITSFEEIKIPQG